MKAIEAWNNTIKTIDTTYIYGAGAVAKKISSLLLYSGKINNLKGYIVSERENNPIHIDGFPVLAIEEVIERDIPVLVSLSEVYHPDVFESLNKLGFERIIPVHRYFSIDLDNANGPLNYDRFIDSKVVLSNDLMEYRKDFLEKYFLACHTFGDGGFYQSFQPLGIKGLRDSSFRIKKYGLQDFITDNTSVLDIGCNIGFLDMLIADSAKSVTGLDYSDSLIELAGELAKKINKDNIEFIRADYNDWIKDNNRRFDVILSFAVHGWLNVEPQIYADQIYSILSSDGIIMFESQQFFSDKMYDVFVDEFGNKGLEIIKEGFIKDDGETDRKYVLLKKSYEG